MTRTYRIAFTTPACHAFGGQTRETVTVQANDKQTAIAEARKNTLTIWANYDRIQSASCPTCGKMSRDERGCAKHKVS